jgi:RNA polymerase sigma factor (sigma-70 family)
MINTPELSQLDDSELAKRIAARDASASHRDKAQQCFEQLYSRHAKLTLAFLASRVRRGDLDDAHQTVWQRVWQFLPSQFHGGSFRAWLHQIARNYVIDLSRRRQTGLFDDKREYSDVRATRPIDVLLEEERTLILKRCLEQLTDEMSELVRARLGGESYEQFCSRSQMPPARAHKLFHQAKQQLSTCVEHALQ